MQHDVSNYRQQANCLQPNQPVIPSVRRTAQRPERQHWPARRIIQHRWVNISVDRALNALLGDSSYLTGEKKKQETTEAATVNVFKIDVTSLCDIPHTAVTPDLIVLLSSPPPPSTSFCSLSLNCVGVWHTPRHVGRQTELTGCWHPHSRRASSKCSW